MDLDSLVPGSLFFPRNDAKRAWPLIQRGKTRTAQLSAPFSALICASPVALLAGSGHNASCNGLQWLETAVGCNKVREDVARLISLYLGQHEIFSACHC